MAAAPLGGPEGLARLLGLLCVVCCFPPGKPAHTVHSRVKLLYKDTRVG